MAGTYIEIPWGAEKSVYTTTFGGRELILGQRGITPDGRTFRWAFSGGIIPAGHVVQTAAAVAADDKDVPVAAAAAVGALTVTITAQGTITANLYQDGYLYVNDVDGEGHLYAIKSHPAGTGSASLVITLWEPIREALTTSSEVGLHMNLFKDVIEHAAGGNTGGAIGVAPTEITDNDYFWCQTSGPCCVLAEDSAMVVGDGVEIGVDVAGAAQLHDVSAETDRMPIGVALLVAPAAGDSAIIDLHLD